MKNFNWAEIQPADERESAILVEAHQRAFGFLSYALLAVWFVALSLPSGALVSQSAILGVLFVLLSGAYGIGWWGLRNEELTGPNRKVFQKGGGLIGWFFTSMWCGLMFTFKGSLPALFYPTLVVLIVSTYTFLAVTTWKRLNAVSPAQKAAMAIFGAIPLSGIYYLSEFTGARKSYLVLISFIAYALYVFSYIVFVQAYYL